MSDRCDIAVIHQMIRDLLHEAGPSYVLGSTSCRDSSTGSSLSDPQKTVHLLLWHLASDVIEESLPFISRCLSREVLDIMSRTYTGDLIPLDTTRNSIGFCILVAFTAFCCRRPGMPLASILKRMTNRQNYLMVSLVNSQFNPSPVLTLRCVDPSTVDGDALHLDLYHSLRRKTLHGDFPDRQPVIAHPLANFFHSFTQKRTGDSSRFLPTDD